MSVPNVLLIVADDMGYGDFSVFNAGRTETPALDRLVSEGVCLTQHYSASPVCAPARAALLTGRYPHRTGAVDTLDGRGLDRIGLGERTLGDLFTAAGYATGLIGKWHSGAIDPRFHPNRRGFGEFVGFRGGWMDYYDWTLDVNGRWRQTDGSYLTDVFTAETIDFLRRHRRRPFFCHLAYNAPHFPLQVPAEDAAPFVRPGVYTSAVTNIYGMIRRMDAGIGRILDELDSLGIADNTLVLFTSDNGPQFGGQGPWDSTRFNCGFRGCKCNVWEGGIRVPMILRWPDGLEGSTGHLDAFVHFTDWLPTLAEAAGIELAPARPLDGHSVLPALRGRPDNTPPRRFWQWNRYRPRREYNAAMRDGDWKLVRPPVGEALQITDEDGRLDRELKAHPDRFDDIDRTPWPEMPLPGPHRPRLFHLGEDPLEQNDLADREADRAGRMLRELEAWFEAVEADRIEADRG